MYTHEMSPNSSVRQARERFYQKCGASYLKSLYVLQQSKNKELRSFGDHWAEDYRLWLEHQHQMKESA